MPKPSTYPLTYEDCKSIEIKLLKKNKLLLPNQLIKSTVRWHINEETTGRKKEGGGAYATFKCVVSR